uniref:Pancreatic trypsin inhibitor n=1 Tax=Rhipicephalus appendiculatus TaxID=34631 RepID=A0A131YHS0_RHIAP
MTVIACIFMVIILYCGEAKGSHARGGQCNDVGSVVKCKGRNQTWFYSRYLALCLKLGNEYCAPETQHGFSTCEECQKYCRIGVCAEKIPQPWWDYLLRPPAQG